MSLNHVTPFTDAAAKSVAAMVDERSKKTQCWSGLNFLEERVAILEARLEALEKAQRAGQRPPNHQGLWP